MDRFTVKQLAKLANVSVRTLHHYDKINLLKPSLRSEAGYRYYGEMELFRLQQILLYRELDLSLLQISEILDASDFDLLRALKGHRSELKKRKQRMLQLLDTVDKTIKQLTRKPDGPATTKNLQMNYEELYKGFSKEQAEAYQKEAIERWGKETIEASQNNLLNMGNDKWEALKQQADDIYKSLAKVLGRSPGDPDVQQLIKQHYQMTGKHFDVTPEIYASLGHMYVEDARFKKYYDKYDPELAVFLRDAILVFVKQHLGFNGPA